MGGSGGSKNPGEHGWPSNIRKKKFSGANAGGYRGLPGVGSVLDGRLSRGLKGHIEYGGNDMISWK